MNQRRKMEHQLISNEIMTRIRLLDKCIKELDTRAEARDVLNATLDKDMAVVVLALRNGKEFTLEGESVKDPPVSVIDRIAKGICWEKSLERDRAESSYSNLLRGIDAVKTQINALQSLNKFQHEV